MSEYEVFDLQLSRLDIYASQATISISLFTLYFSVIAAYLVVAYQAGSKLTKSQVFIATSIYLFAAIVFGLTIIISQVASRVTLMAIWDWAVILETDYGHKNSMEKPGFLGERPYLALLLLFLSTTAPLFFMWGVRHPKTDRD